MSSQASTITAGGDGPKAKDLQELVVKDASESLDLSFLPPIFVLPTHLETGDLHALETQIDSHQGHLTYDAREAKIFLGKISQKRRAVLELRSIGLETVEFEQREPFGEEHVNGEPARKRLRVNAEGDHPHDAVTRGAEDSSTSSELDQDAEHHRLGALETSEGLPLAEDEPELTHADSLIVLSLSWFEDSVRFGLIQPMENYQIYKGKKVALSPSATDLPSATTIVSLVQTGAVNVASARHNAGEDILARAREELGPDRGQTPKAFASTTQMSRHKRKITHTAKLVQQTTEDYDSDSQATELPDMPEWVKKRSIYSCERSTPIEGPNEAFIKELKKIRLARTLTGDEIGVRAYSTSIAAIAAYPRPITDRREVVALPGCDAKIAALWNEWAASGGKGMQAARDAEADEELSVLRLFYDIWGVGARTARDFYNRGWRDLDDVVEYGWNSISRVQQIGVKYFDEFQLKIPRAEVESIAAIVHEHAQRVREPSGIRSVIVGGYRRGKVESGDVDVIVTHMDESQTLDIVQDIVRSLTDAGWITHELSTTLQGTRRGQATLPFRNAGGGHGFDTLDKALVVWQNPEWLGQGDAPPGTKNPNVHRRVDIIIAPWSKIGCAVLGWSAGTTFERDLRRYAKRRKGWKFDSSGIRDRTSGQEVDLEGVGGTCKTALEAEKKVFAGLGLVYREPWERCTG